jgi:hypothetical protein
LHAYLHPAASARLPHLYHFQDHLVLESIPVSGSSCIGQFYSGHRRIRMVSFAGIITTVAGNGGSTYSGDGGLATIAALGTPTNSFISNSFFSYVPQGLAVDRKGNIYIADTGSGRLRVVTTDGKINTIAGGGPPAGPIGDNGAATSAQLSLAGVALGGEGKVYISDHGFQFFGSDVVRLLTPSATPVFPVPSIATNGVVSASAWGQFSQLAQGSWAEIYGSYLASDSRGWTGADFNGASAPPSLDGTSVTIGGSPAVTVQPPEKPQTKKVQRMLHLGLAH